MDKKIASTIIKTHSLIRSKDSKRILKAIQLGKFLSQEELPNNVKLNEIENLRNLYNINVQKNSAPRNLVFYFLLKELYPSFSWELSLKKTISSYNVEITSPRVKGLRPSLLSLLLKRVNYQYSSALYNRYPFLDSLPDYVVKHLLQLLTEICAIFPSKKDMKKIYCCINNSLSGGELLIFSPVCPDYSVELTGNLTYPFRHTFNSVGSNVGLVAKRIIEALPHIINFFETVNIKFKIIIGMGDFEAFSEENLIRVKLTKTEFLNRINNSKNMLKNILSSSIEVCNVTDLFGGHANWFKYYDNSLALLKQNNFGSANLTRKEILNIARKRKNLYDRWYGNKNIQDHVPRILMQGAEYSAMGAILAGRNCLILGADNDAMKEFYSLYCSMPILYLKRFYL